MSRFVRLDSPACTALWEVGEGEAPLWRYWGPRLPDGVTPETPLRATRPEPSFSLAHDAPLSLFPGLGLGWFGQSALLAHRQGRDWCLAATSCRIEQPAPERLRFVLQDEVAGIEVAITAVLDPESDVLSLSTVLSNRGDAPLEVQSLAAGNLPLPDDALAVRSFSGRHNGEFVEQQDALSRSLWRRENRRGITAHDCFPGAIVTCGDGVAFGAQLCWSGNHFQQIEWLDDGRWHWQMGEWLAPGEVILAPGESIASPEMLATSSVEGANGVAWAFHREIRKRIPWPDRAMKPRPVHLNTWEACYFDHDEAGLIELASAAAAIGVERFVLDDGWFKGRADDRSSLGDWVADADKYPNGLGPLARHVTELGMEFGLWVEPEMANPDSDLFRSHPEWALTIEGRPLLLARNQLVLDLARDEVSDYLFGTLSALLRELPVSYLKWDHNRDLAPAGNRPRYRAQVLATYALMDRIRTAFPHVEIEACAGGGGRIDAGIAAHTHRFWTSDNIDAVSRVAIQRGFLQFLPPEMMGAHVGASPAHATGRSQSLDFRAGIALPGHFGIELDPRLLSTEDKARLAGWVARYKTLRKRLHSGRVWLGEAGDGLLWQAHGEPHDLIVQVIRIAPQGWRHAPHLRLPILDRERRYRIGDDIHDGAWLAAHGLALPPMKAESCLLLEVTAL